MFRERFSRHSVAPPGITAAFLFFYIYLFILSFHGRAETTKRSYIEQDEETQYRPAVASKVRVISVQKAHLTARKNKTRPTEVNVQIS